MLIKIPVLLGKFRQLPPLWTLVGLMTLIVGGMGAGVAVVNGMTGAWSWVATTLILAAAAVAAYWSARFSTWLAMQQAAPGRHR